MSDYTIDWANTNIDGTNTASNTTGSVGFTVSTPENIDHDQWVKANVGGTDALKAWRVDDPTSVLIDFDEEVTNVSFELLDVDSDIGTWDDRVTVIARDAAGNILPVIFTNLATHHHVSGNVLSSNGYTNRGPDGSGADDSVTVQIAGAVASLEIVLDSGSGAAYSGTVGLSDITFDAIVAETGDGYVDGTTGNDTIISIDYTDADGDMIHNNDALLPGEGANDDVVLAGSGDDLVLAKDGDDEIYGGNGDDTLFGHDGDDVIYGGRGNDILHGMNNNDVLLGEAGNDTIYGGAGNDVISGGTGHDNILDGSGDDLATGGKGNDAINMGSGNDVAYGGGGADSMLGGAGNDTLIGGNMTFDGTLDFNDLDAGDVVEGQYIANGVTITSADPKNPVMAFDTANPTGEDNDLATSNLGKVLILSEDRDSSDPDVNGSGGTFNITFDAPASVTSLTLLDVDGGATVTYLDSDGNVLQTVDVTTADNGQFVVSTDLQMVASIEVTLGASGAIDNLTYSIDPDTMDGNDVIDGGTGDDYIEGNAGNDTLTGGDGADDIWGGGDRDVIFGGAGDTVNGGGNGDDYDILDLTGQGPFVLENVTEDGNGNGINGTVVFVDGDGNPTGETLIFTEIEEVVGEEVNRGPDAVNDDVITDEDTSVTIDVLDNDTDADGDDLTVTGATVPAAQGTVEIVDNQVVFTPADDFNGEATITYTIEDGNGGTDTATVNVTVNAVNDQPIVYTDQYFVTEVEGEGDVDGNVITNPSDNGAGLDIDPDGDTLTVVAVNGDAGGVGSEIVGSNGGVFTLNPDGSFDFTANGEFEFLSPGETQDTVIEYTVSDGNGGTATATLTITVQGINDGPDAIDDTADTNEDEVIVIDVLDNDEDPEGDDLTIIAATVPADQGTVEIVDNMLVFTPADDFNGEATISYTIEDEDGATDSAVVTVDVAAVNDGPEAGNDDYAVDQDDPSGDIDGNVLENDTDLDGDTIRVTSVSNGTDTDAVTDPFGALDSPATVAGDNGGIVTINNGGNVLFDPNDEFDFLAEGETTTSTVTYTIEDENGATDTATVTFTITGVNDGPVAVDSAYVVDQAEAFGDVDGNAITDDTGEGADSDPEGDDLTVVAVDGAAGNVGGVVAGDNGGEFTINDDGTVDFNANGDFDDLGDGETASTSVSYTIADENGLEDTATVTFTVTGTNDAPVSVLDTDETDQDTAIVLDNVLGNDVDPEGDDLTVSEVDGVAGNVGAPVAGDNGGLITINSNGTASFDPNGDFDDLPEGETEDTSVTYTIVDEDGLTDTTTVTITVTGTNDAPIAQTQTESTDEDTPITVDLLDNDSDVDGDNLTVVSAELVSGEGSIVNNGDGTVTFTPADDFNGEAVIAYTIEDEDGLQASSTHVITVEGVDDAPEAEDDTAETDEDTPVTIDVLENDQDPDGDELTITAATVPADQGTVEIVDGELVFTPADDFTGEATITYTVADPAGNEDTATVAVTVNPVNDAPTAVNDSDTTDFDTPVTVDLLDNDFDVDGDDLTVIDATVPADQGRLLDNGNGTVTFTPADGFTGEATISYTIEDEDGLTSSAIHTITVGEDPRDGTVEGTDVNDVINGGYTGDPDGDRVDNDDAILPGDVGDDDLIYGFGGDDSINAGQGDDEVFGGTGDDIINGHAGNDTLSGDEGDDTITGGRDNDTIFGGDDNDVLDGDSGDDSIDGDDGDDSILGGGGEDTIFGGGGNDTIDGEYNDDVISGGAGDDVIDGGDGNDEVEAGSGDDTVFGGQGNDDLWTASGDDDVFGGAGDDTIGAGDGNDYVEGGTGNDTIDTSGHAPLPDLSFGNIIPADGETIVLPDGSTVTTSPTDDLDTVFGGAGNDTITTGDDADFIDGGVGDDFLDGGIDADEIIGGDGDDTIVGGEGSDSISGGEGNDTIFAGVELGTDLFGIPEQIDDDLGDPEPDNGDDLVFGGAGNDTIFGADDSDVLYGDEGDDVIDGEIDDDTLFGGDGNDDLDGGANDDTIFGDDGDDTITGGTGVDELDGGQGNDTFLGGNGGDVVVGGEDPDVDGDGNSDDVDVLDLTGSNVDFITYDETDPTFENGVGESGTVTFLDGSTMTFSEIESVIPCFTPGTTIATPKGERLVEELREGDRIITRDNGIQEIRWVGRKEMSGKALVANPNLKPILVRAGSLGNGLPERDMLVSPNHRMLVASDKTQLYFEESEVLAAAKHLVGSEGIHAVDVMGTAYIHFMFDNHEVVLSNGAWTESFQPGDYSLKGIGNSQRNEIFELFPELQSKVGLEGYQSARRALKKHEAKLLIK